MNQLQKASDKLPKDSQLVSQAIVVYFEGHESKTQQLEAMEDTDILPKFEAIAIHDFWNSYYNYCREHGLCNAYQLREMVFVNLRYMQGWAGELAALLLKMRTAKEGVVAKGKWSFSEVTLKCYRSLYFDLLQKRLTASSYNPPPKKTSGPDKKTNPRNLIERFRDYVDDILRFF